MDNCKAEALPENGIKKKQQTQQTRQKDVKLNKNSFFTFVQKVVSLLKLKLSFLLSLEETVTESEPDH